MHGLYVAEKVPNSNLLKVEAAFDCGEILKHFNGIQFHLTEKICPQSGETISV
jgi:hypothetical protein